MGAQLLKGRMTADASGEVVVFLIGMRVNRWRALRSWLPAARAMPRMLKELSADPGSGLLGFHFLRGDPRTFYTVQYWESREKLLAYAAQPDAEHRPAWAAFNRRAREGRGDVGVWHETYVVPAGGYENVYVDMPAFGLGAAHGTAPVARRGDRAAQRFAAG
jgi:heme-degrading monooxygenase HmoA